MKNLAGPISLHFLKKHLVAQQLLGVTSRLIPIQARVQTPDHRRVEFGQYLSWPVVLKSLEIPDWTLWIVRHVFILGPSHRVYFTQCATPVVDSYETPLGNLKLDDEIIQKLQVALQYINAEQPYNLCYLVDGRIPWDECWNWRGRALDRNAITLFSSRVQKSTGPSYFCPRNPIIPRLFHDYPPWRKDKTQLWENY